MIRCELKRNSYTNESNNSINKIEINIVRTNLTGESSITFVGFEFLSDNVVLLNTAGIFRFDIQDYKIQEVI